MSDDLRSQIAANLNRKTTDELLTIWITNDRVEWSSTAFDAIETILQQRLDTLPPQNEPILEHLEQDWDGPYDARILAEKTVHPYGEPVFYRPPQVLWLVRWLNKFAPIAVAITFVVSLPGWFSLRQTIASYFAGNPEQNFIALLIALPVGALAVALQCWLVYFPLKSLASILRILMEMEFNSRIGPEPASVVGPPNSPLSA